MPKYAVEIGKVILRSGKPITEEERKEATARLERLSQVLVFEGEGYKVWAAVR